MITYVTFMVWVLLLTISWKILEMYYYTHCIRWGNNMLHCQLDTIDVELGLHHSLTEDNKNMYLMNYTLDASSNKASYA